MVNSQTNYAQDLISRRQGTALGFNIDSFLHKRGVRLDDNNSNNVRVDFRATAIPFKQVQCWITWWIATSRQEPGHHRYTVVTAPEFSTTKARARTPCFKQGLKRFYPKRDKALVTSLYPNSNKSFIKMSGPNSFPKCHTELQEVQLHRTLMMLSF